MIIKTTKFCLQTNTSKEKVIKPHFQESAGVLGLSSTAKQEIDTRIGFLDGPFINSISCLHQLIVVEFHPFLDAG